MHQLKQAELGTPKMHVLALFLLVNLSGNPFRKEGLSWENPHAHTHTQVCTHLHTPHPGSFTRTQAKDSFQNRERTPLQ